MDCEAQPLPYALAVRCARAGSPRFTGSQAATRGVGVRDLTARFGVSRARGMRLASLVLQEAACPFGRPVDEEPAA